MAPRPKPVSRSNRRFGLARTVERLRESRQLVHATRVHLHDRLAFYALLVAGLVVFALAVWPFVRSHLQAIAILQLVSGQPVPSAVKEVVSDPFTPEDITLPLESGVLRARLYLPLGKPHAPALVVLHGVHHLGIDEPRLQSFASAMASCGIQVLTPELPDIKDYHISSTSIARIGEAVQWFDKRTGGPVGVMGLSFSGGLALLAASDPLYHPDIKFVFAVGSQDSMNRVASYYGTGEDARPNGTMELLPAHEYGPLVLEYEYLEDFVPPADIPSMRFFLRAHLYENKDAEDDAYSYLTESQKVAAKQLLDTNSPKTRRLIAATIAKHAEELQGISPRGVLRTMTTPVYLLHGEADNIIPSAETLWMASELPRTSLQAALVSPVISHIDFEHANPTLMDQWRLIHFFALVMHAVETPSGKKPWI
jgi:dienelactone hydrolase